MAYVLPDVEVKQEPPDYDADDPFDSASPEPPVEREKRRYNKKNRKGPRGGAICTKAKPFSQVKVPRLPSSFVVPPIFHPGLRILDLNLLAHWLWCKHCNLPLSLRHSVRDDGNIYRTLLQIRCMQCQGITIVPLSQLEPSGDIKAYCKKTNRDFNYTMLAGKCKQMGEELELLNSMTPRPSQRGRPPPDVRASLIQSRPPTDAEQIQAAILQSQNMHSQDFPDVKEEMCATMFVEAQINGDNETADLVSQFMESCDDSESDFEEEKIPKKVRKFIKVEDESGSDNEGKNAKKTVGGAKIKEESPKQAVLDKCIYCPLEFPTFRRLKAHMASSHPEYNQFKCGACSKQCESKEQFNNHILANHKASKFRLCPHCGKLCSSNVALASHLMSHSTELDATIPCPHCPKMLKTKLQLQKHVSTHQPGFTCDFCCKTIRTRTRLIEHMMLHIENKTYDCEFCGAKFMRKDNRNTHIKNNHNWVCLICPSKFRTMEEAKGHVEASHTMQEVYNIVGSGVSYEKVTRFQCQICLRYLASKQSLEFHVATHTGEGKRRQNVARRGRARGMYGKVEPVDY